MTPTQHNDREAVEEPMPADLPQFASVMRGYDRGQVDDYVARLIDFLGDAEQRASRAERGLADALRRNERLTEQLREAIERQDQTPEASRPYEGLGERVETILRLAADEADELRQRGRSDAADILEEAKRRRDQERQRAEQELGAVADRRDGVVAELRRVQDVLATLGLRQAFETDELPVPKLQRVQPPEPAAQIEPPNPTAASEGEATPDVQTAADETMVIDLRAAQQRAAGTR
jgi:DivIVA domain-containing protein